MSLRAHLTPTLVAVAVTSALVGGGAAYGITTAIDGHQITNHTVDAWKLTPAAQSFLRGPGVLGTVPSGRTLTGDFMVTLPYQSLGTGEGLVSFPQGFTSTLTATWVPAGTTTTSCPGTVTAPTALPGHFCAYVSYSIGTLGSILDPAPAPNTVPPAGATGKRGVLLTVSTGTGSQAFAQGSWAATAP